MPSNSTEYMKQYFHQHKDKFDKPVFCQTCQKIIKGHKNHHERTKAHIVKFISF